ncbi:hypothetical protein N7632_17315 [Pseudomonas atacamensis]|jgi:hypothetical protein|uniref:hypothetical protein n=1 Tax=unclassified Pseudomonas TaxID=196821 RepID=UPI001A9D2BCB|nr:MULTISPECIES: hypothetical protein [Pseudomonas]MDH1258253.1 hypothetical protein [Pseudomonas atacamensis]MDT6920925.1 hypothetical protein [Pseudomonas atacamensis]MEB2855393.1 hypothetical protein [Pseudomonas atacamensis]GLH18730.1 hypothetical protein BR1R3_14710 [Pseudomonas atacamensis]
MNTEKIKNLDGKITFDELTSLDGSKIALPTDKLREDLLQASFPHEQIIDIGWYPEFSEHGAFRISLIANQNWNSPIYTETAKTLDDLEKALDNTLDKVKKLKASTRSRRLVNVDGSD